MTAIPYDPPEEEWGGYEEEDPIALPQRPHRRFGGRATAALIALIVGAIGFYAGVRVEKTQLPAASSTGGGLAAAFAAARGGAGGASGTAGTRGTRGAAGLAGAFGGRLGALGGGNSSFGTVSSVSGKTIYVTETGTGNVVKVSLSSATKITKSVGVGRSAINPGDTVVVQGLKGSGGTISATAVNDSGASGARSAGGSSGGSAGSSSASSAVNSLFGGGG